jgi:hypothetical protein
MELLSIVFLIIGVIISIVFGLQLLFVAFRTSVIWGLGYLFVPFVSLIFVIVHWDDAKKPFLRGLLAIPFIILAVVLSPDTAV